MKNNKIKTISFLASGRGSNFVAVAENILSGNISAKIGIIISDKEDAPCLVKAESMGIDHIFIDPKKFSTREDHEKEIIRNFDSVDTDLVVAAGYMRILTSHFISRYRMKIINIHPSLLPSFPGKDAQKQALEHGVRITGCTTHFMDEGTDTGPIILQTAVNIRFDDDVASLSERILQEEHKILPESVRLFCENKITVINNRIIIN